MPHSLAPVGGPCWLEWSWTMHCAALADVIALRLRGEPGGGREAVLCALRMPRPQEWEPPQAARAWCPILH